MAAGSSNSASATDNTIRPLRVAILGSRGYPSTYGGFETLVRRLAPFLHSRGQSVIVYGRGSAHLTVRTGMIDGIRIVTPPGVDSKSLSTLSFGVTAAIHAAWERPDAVLVLNVANGFALPLLRARGIPTVVNVDGIEWERAKWGPVARRVFRVGAALTARFADVIIADSRAIAAIWRQRFDVDPIFIPYGADVLEGASADLLEGYQLKAHKYALVVARLAPENNVDLFLDALEVLDWSICGVVVGSANYDAPLATRLERLHQDGRVVWLGHVADQALLTQLWSNAGMYFHGHSAGGTNPALLQALGCGAPTIAIATRYNREVIENEDQVIERNAHLLARRIANLIGDDKTRSRFRSHGQTIVKSRYRWADVCGAYESVLGTLATHGCSPLRRLRATPQQGPP